MVPWMFFASSISDMVESLVLNMNLVSKIYFPREILPIAALFARFFDFIIASIVLGVLLYYFHIQLSITAFIFLPAILLIQIFLALGIGLIGAGLNVFYRDIKHLFVLGLQIWFYASPIIYSITSVPERFRFVYFLNPMAGVIQSYRDVLLYQKLTGSGLIISLVSAVVVMIIGYWFFKRVEFQFADVV
jgi:lipopolysaccharide transport system permease protein